MVEPGAAIPGDASAETPLPSAARQEGEDRAEEAQLKPIFDDPAKNKGLGQHGCQHYRRRCLVRAPCCGEEFACRHCHNLHQEQKADSDHHELPRHDVTQVICLLCGTEQQVQQFCQGCGVCLGQYFCQHCKFFDDDVSKRQFHCDDCGICRVGGRDKFFHCPHCGCCYALSLRGNHRCVEKAMNHNCPVCFEYLFDSLQPTAVLEKCGHTLHSSCLASLTSHAHTFVTCPVCAKSIGDNSSIWAFIDQKIAEDPMPPEVERKQVGIICNDCEKCSTVTLHYYGLKCQHCGSYNTRQ